MIDIIPKNGDNALFVAISRKIKVLEQKGGSELYTTNDKLGGITPEEALTKILEQRKENTGIPGSFIS